MYLFVNYFVPSHCSWPGDRKIKGSSPLPLSHSCRLPYLCWSRIYEPRVQGSCDATCHLGRWLGCPVALKAPEAERRDVLEGQPPLAAWAGVGGLKGCFHSVCFDLLFSWFCINPKFVDIKSGMYSDQTLPIPKVILWLDLSSLRRVIKIYTKVPRVVMVRKTDRNISQLLQFLWTMSKSIKWMF